MTKAYGSIRDVAKATGLSIATISRVMNGNKSVSPKTRERVLTACEELDYLPNPAARALSTSKSKTIAAIIPTIGHSVFAKYVAAIENCLSEHGYSLVLAISNSDPDEELVATRKLLGMGAQAFILTGAVHNKMLLDLLTRRDVPHVFTSIWDPQNSQPTIGYDNRGLATEAVNFLADKGHRYISVIHGSTDESDRMLARVMGAKDAVRQNLRLTFHETELSVAGGKAAVRASLNQHAENTAILCFSDVLALGAYFCLQDEGKKVAEDVSVMGFDNLDWSSDITPPLTTINLPAAAMGREVATQIIRFLEKGDGLNHHFLSAEIVERGSVKTIKH